MRAPAPLIYTGLAFWGTQLTDAAAPTSIPLSFSMTTFIPSNSKAGYVYIVINEVFSHLIKVGATRLHPSERTAQLGAPSGVPVDYELAYYRDFSDCFKAETRFHNVFEKYRFNKSREFFDMPLTEAVSFIDQMGSGQYWDLTSTGDTGGSALDGAVRAAARVNLPSTPFADLFATFEEREDGLLNEEERGKVSVLRARLAVT